MQARYLPVAEITASKDGKDETCPFYVHKLLRTVQNVLKAILSRGAAVAENAERTVALTFLHRIIIIIIIRC